MLTLTRITRFNPGILYTLWVLLSALAVPCPGAQAQNRFSWLKTDVDTSYVRDYTRDLTARLYFSRKYAGYGVRDYRQNQELLYRPNHRLNFGVGLNYYFLGLNLGVNMPFVNNDDDRYGQTRYLDAQSHIYLSKFTVDLYLQYYKGHYLSKPQDWIENWQPGSPFPKRGDLRTISTGISVHYIFNHRRFSYRAAYLQNEWQKKSAGTFLAGSEFYRVHMQADSSVTAPARGLAPFFGGVQFSQSVVYSFGANAGYAYTFVYKSNFFLSLALVGGVGLGSSRLMEPGAEDLVKTTLHFNTTARAAIGYNSPRYYAGFSVVNLALRSQTPVGRSAISFDTGNFRLNFCRRFKVKPPFRSGK
jgi:hypothetical protein